jgi:hypothetical protein
MAVGFRLSQSRKRRVLKGKRHEIIRFTAEEREAF